ncbi:MAG: helix-turn-helix transcriptional regulator [Leptolyngbya sp. SIOISBB]|nr:helix-turn-helix transcriptional regulator [Leptolyngbya sp. SIOISBB]
MAAYPVLSRYSDWLLPGSSDDPRLLHVDPSDEIWLYPSPIGQGYRQNIHLRDDLTLVIVDYAIHRHVIYNFPAEETGVKFEFPITQVNDLPSRFLPMTASNTLGAHQVGKRVFEIEVVFKGHDSLQTYTQACMERLSPQNQRLIEEMLKTYWQFQGGRSGLDQNAIINCLIASLKANAAPDESLMLEYALPDPLYIHSVDLDYANCQPITSAMRSVMTQILSCPYQGKTRRQYLEAKAQELVALRIQAIKQPRLPPFELSCIYQAASVLRSQIINPPTVEALARRVNTNRLKLNQGFHAVYGTTPMQYLRNCRLALAQRLLMTSEMSVEQIAAAVGYDSRNYFARAFRRRTGLNPKTFQMQIQLQMEKLAS